VTEVKFGGKIFGGKNGGHANLLRVPDHPVRQPDHSSAFLGKIFGT
jgi:hypothetical protein